MTEILIAVELSPDTAAKIRFMAEEGVFNLQKGNVLLHFDEGKLLTIKTERIAHAPKISTNEALTSSVPHVTLLA